MAIQWWKTYLLIAIFRFYQGVAGQINNCPTEDNLVEEFNNVSKFMKIHGDDGKVCFMENDEHEDEDHNEDIFEEMTNFTNCSSCEDIYHMCRTIILNLELTSEDCLEDHNHNNDTSGRVSSAQAYGYGFMMILLVCLGSLGGIFLVPLIKKDSKVGKQTYEYVYAFMIATGASALVSDAILHLIPHAFGLHSHEEDSHSHNNAMEDIDFIWKGCVVLGGIYTFFIVEVILHGLGHDHSSEKKSKEENCAEYRCPSEDVHFTSSIPESFETSLSSNNEVPNNGNDEENVLIKKPKHMCSCHDVKPVAWLIIIGDSLHNFADGLALGAAISQSLSLGVSTMLALLFHEIPHELGDYVILIKAGIHWFTALIINFLSSLTSIVGFFIGVAISTNNTEANGWILSLTAGLFLYIALTDLLPELIHGGGHGEKTKNIAHGWSWFIRFALANLGILIAFALLFLLAIYEEKLNELI